MQLVSRRLIIHRPHPLMQSSGARPIVKPSPVAASFPQTEGKKSKENVYPSLISQLLREHREHFRSSP